MQRLAIVVSHPIQYNSPWFRMLAERGNIQVKVFYTWSQSETGSIYDRDFGKTITWDIPLLEGYDYSFVPNEARDAGIHHFFGIHNPGLIKVVSQWRPDVLLVIRWSFRSHLQCLIHFKGKIPILTRGDSTLLDEGGGLKSFLRRLLLRWVYRHVDHAMYVGHHSRAYFKKFGFDDASLWHVPHAIDNDRFYPTEQVIEQGKAWREHLNISSEAIILLFAGKMEPKKNPGLLMQAFVALKREHVHLVLVGNGVLEKALKVKYREEANIHFLDFKNQSEMPGIYNMCDVFVLTSQGPEETWGLALNEAMAGKKPVIASNKCGGAIDLVQNGRNGYIFESGDVDALITILDRMTQSTTSLSEMGEQSYEIVKQSSFERICDGIEDLVEKIT